MNDKFLPVGSIVNIKNINKPIIITGFLSMEYNNAFNVFDYCGYTYPEGQLKSEHSFKFNHNDIIDVIYKGYVSESHDILNKNLKKYLNIEVNNSEKEKISFKFDSNGVVVFDSSQKSEEIVIEQPVIENPFNQKVQDTNDIEFNNSNGLNSMFKFKFDENGTVISDDSIEVKPTQSESVPSVSKNTSGFKFDSNGTVISDGGIKENVQSDNSSTGFKFDSNGTVISDGGIKENVQSDNSSTGFKFDSNGTVISENTLEHPVQIKDEPGGFKFDSNGMVISEN